MQQNVSNVKLCLFATAYMYNKIGMNNYPIYSALYKVMSYMKSTFTDLV